MAKTTVAEFVADLEVRVKNLKGLNDFSDKLNNLPNKFKKVTDSVTSSQKSLGSAVGKATKDIGKQRAELEKTTKAFWDNAEAQRVAASVAKAAHKISNKWNSKQIVKGKTASQASSLGGMYGNQTGFKRLSVVEDYAKKIADSKLSNVMSDLDKKSKEDSIFKKQRDALDKLHGKALKEDASRNKANQTRLDREQEAFDKLHAKAIRENAKFDARKIAAAERLAKIEQNAIESAAALRERLQNRFAGLIRSDLSAEQRQVERIARIRAAGAKAGISQHHIEVAVARSNANFEARQSSGQTRGTGGSGRGFSVMGGATVGGAIGSASSTAAGFLPGFGGAYALVNFNQIGQQLVALENAMLAVSDSEQVAAERMAFLNEIGAEMGYTLRDIGPEFVKLAASIDDTALAGKEQGIFKSFMKYGTVMGLNPEEMKGSFRAVSQMINKQQVYAEELKGQLAERMPAAVKIAAKAMSKIEGRTVEVKELMKMMEEGKLDPNSLLPAMAEVMDELVEKNDAYIKALNTSATAQRRMNYQFEKFVGLFTKSGGEQAFAKIFNAIADFLKDNPKLAQGMANAMTKFATAMDYTMIAATNLINGLDQLGDSLGVGGTNLAIMIASAAVLSTHFGRIATAAYALFLILEDISVGMNGGDSYTKDFLDFLEENKWVAAAAGATAFAGALGMVLSQLGKIGTASKVLSGGAATGAAGGILSSLMRHPMLTGLTAGIGFTLAYSQSQLSEWGSTNKEGISQVSKGMTEFNDKRYAEVPVQTLLDRIASLAVQNQSVNIGDTTVHLTVTGLDPATQYDQIGLKIAEVFTNELLVASQNHVTGKTQ